MKKAYNYIINLIKTEYKLVIVLILILFLGLFHLPYNLYVGGGTISLLKRLEVDNEYLESGSFNLAYVTSIRSTIPTYLLSYLFNWERENINDVKLDENDNTKDMWEREKLYLQEANDNAIISAYKEAGEEINIKSEILKILYIDSGSDTDLKVGDTIISIMDKPIKEFSDIKNILIDYQVGDKLNIKYLRDNKEYDGYFVVRNLDGEKKAGLYLIKLFDYNIKRKVELKFSNSEGGPSGGFITSLAIYNRLTSFDLTKGRKIVGTGTIDSEGNVGEIGGIKYKLSGAVRGKADIFFVPKDNYEEAMKIKKEKGYDINIVMINTLHEAIEYLKR